MLKNLLIVALGGGVGSVARYLCQRWVGELFAYPFPLGTFVVNVCGCFLIGVILGLADKNSLLSSEWRLLLATGFCGGYTTFSAFAFENAGLLKAGHLLTALLYIVLSVVLGVIAVFGGLALFR